MSAKCSSALCIVKSLPERYTRVYPLQGLHFQQVPRRHSRVLGALCDIVSHCGSDALLVGNFCTPRYLMSEPKKREGVLVLTPNCRETFAVHPPGAPPPLVCA